MALKSLKCSPPPLPPARFMRVRAFSTNTLTPTEPNRAYVWGTGIYNAAEQLKFILLSQVYYTNIATEVRLL